MKFTNGYWLMREGVKAAFPAQAYDIDATPASLTVYAPTKPVRQRGDTLDGPMLTVQFSSPLADVIRVKLTHFAEYPTLPHFELFEQPDVPVTVTSDEQFATLTSGRLTVRVSRGPKWQVDFVGDERVITGSGPKGMGIIQNGNGHFMHEQLSLGVGENVYGLGERFTAFVKNGQVIDIWNEDGGTSSEQAYKSIPFYLTNRGYGVLVNHPEKVSFEVASEKVSRVQFSVAGQSLEYFIIYGPSPKEVLQKYTALTGRPALPPPWSFGLWLTTSFTTSYDEQTVTSFIQGMADRDLPLHVFHFDCFWMKEYHWTDLQWDERVFPDPAAMLQRLKARGLRICLWINPYIAQRSALFAEGLAQGYLVTRPNGQVWQWDLWQAGMALVDFTNPAACRWFAEKLRALLEMGVDCFKTDFGERIPTDVVYHNGADPQKMHNYYTHLYNKLVFDLLREVRGEAEAVVFARSATVGGQQFPVHWGGDCDSTFESMAESLRGGLSLGLSGFGFWSHDIGGFEGTPPVAVYKRWLAFGLLSSHSRLHGNVSYRVPWLFDEEAVAVLRHFTHLKCRLMPYLFAQAITAAATGAPVMRPMLLEFPTDPTADFLDRQYMLGDSLLVAPVFSAEGEVSYYLPAGRWTNFFTGQTIDGPGWQHEQHNFMSLPLLVRPNSLVAMGGNSQRPDYDYTEGLTLRLYQLGEGQAVMAVIPAADGSISATFTASREQNVITLAPQGAAKLWQLLLVGIGTADSVEGGSAESTAKGLQITPHHPAETLRVRLG